LEHSKYGRTRSMRLQSQMRHQVNRQLSLMKKTLDGKKVAILVADGFEQIELTSPQEALEDAGAETEIISPAEDKVKGWEETDWGKKFKVDVPLKKAKASDYDTLLLPGGVMNPDKLRLQPKAIEFIRAFFDAGKPVAAICHGPWTLIDAGIAEGRRLTSYPSIKNDLKNAGADWVDETVVVDNGLVTSRKPADLPAFNRKMIEEFAEGYHGPRGRSIYGRRAMAASGVD
jgi:protease I